VPGGFDASAYETKRITIAARLRDIAFDDAFVLHELGMR
jgi:hypothetical protein